MKINFNLDKWKKKDKIDWNREIADFIELMYNWAAPVILSIFLAISVMGGNKYGMLWFIPIALIGLFPMKIELTEEKENE